MSMLKIGWSEKNITSDKRISLAGQFAERISEYVEKPLTFTAMAVENGQDQMVLCSIDVVSIGWNLVEAVRAAVAKRVPDLDPRKIVIAAIHTHTGPVFPRISRVKGGAYSFRSLLETELPKGKKYIESAPVSSDPTVATPQENYDLILNQAVEAIAEAWNSRSAGSFSNAFGRAAVGMCRRAAYSDGSAQMWGDTNTAVFTQLEGGSDTGIELMYIFNENKKLTGIAANLACPAQCVQHRLFVSPDFWGEVKMLLRKHFGEDLFLLPLCSAAGDQCPVDLVRWVEPESDVHDPNLTRNNPPRRKADPSMFDLAGMRKTGRRIAREIIDVYNDGLDEAQADTVFEHRVEDFQLPLRRATLAEAAVARKAIREYLREKEGDVDYNDAAKLQVHLGILRRMELQEVVDIVETEVHLIRLGSIAIATNPFELFLDYGNQIKARSLAEQTFLVQLANGTEGYLPTEKAEKGGHYSAFISSGKVGHAGGEQLVRQTLKGINQMFTE